jgi:hypothetical protein
MISSKQYYDILFDDSDEVCVGSTPYNILLTPIADVKNIGNNNEFIAINPFMPGTTRRDANVIKFRNILLEFDAGTIDEQRAYIEALKIPYSTITFSGSKSLHVIISLETPAANKDEYDAIVHRIFTKVPKADPTTKNCSRFTRAPNARRGDKWTIQHLIYAGNRIKNSAIEAWLGPIKDTPKYVSKVREVADKKILKSSTWKFLRKGAPKGSWNVSMFVAALDMLRAGFSLNHITEVMTDITGNLDRTDKATLKSALDIFTREG